MKFGEQPTYSRTAYEDTEKGIQDVKDIAQGTDSVEDLRALVQEKRALETQKADLHDQAWSEAIDMNKEHDALAQDRTAQAEADAAEAARIRAEILGEGAAPETTSAEAVPDQAGQESTNSAVGPSEKNFADASLINQHIDQEVAYEKLGLANMPDIKKLESKSAEEMDAMAVNLRTENELTFVRGREQSEASQQTRADERNKGRTWYEKLTGRNKLTAVDIAQEEASRINKLVDQKIEREGAETSAQIASEKIARSSEFYSKEEAIIKAEEFLRSKNPDIVKALQSGDVATARAAFVKLSEKMKDDEKGTMRKGFEKMISGQVDTLVQSGDLEGMKKLVQENKVDDVGPMNIAMMPKEIIQSPDVQVQIVTGIERVFSGNREFGLNEANKYVKLGLITRESAQKLFQSEGFQRKLTGDIERVFSGNHEFGLNEANKYVKLGLITSERANQIISSLRARKAA